MMLMPCFSPRNLLTQFQPHLTAVKIPKNTLLLQNSWNTGSQGERTLVSAWRKAGARIHSLFMIQPQTPISAVRNPSSAAAMVCLLPLQAAWNRGASQTLQWSALWEKQPCLQLTLPRRCLIGHQEKCLWQHFNSPGFKLGLHKPE